MKSLTRNWFLGVAGCLILAAGIALAKKPDNPGGGGGGGGDKTVAIHGCITFADRDLDVDGVDDSVKSDNGGSYCDSIDSTVDLLEFFRFHVEFAKDGTGRTLSLDIADVMDDPTDLPANADFWTLAMPVSLDDLRSQAENVPVDRNGRLAFGKRKDVLVILYGDFDHGFPLIVTRTGVDVWTIEGELADVARQAKGNAKFDVLGSGYVPFKVTYDGTK